MKSLSVILAGEPVSSLRALAGWWGAEPPSADTADARQKLERAMRDTIAARFVWEHLGENERRVLFAVAGPSARNWCLVDSIADRAHMSPEEAQTSLTRLVDDHLVFLEQAKVQGTELVGQRVTFYGYSAPRNTQAAIEDRLIAYVPTELVTSLYASGRELFISHADRSDKTMDELLMPYRQGDLDQIGRRFGLSVQAYYSRNEVRAAIAENLTQAEAVRYALARVDMRLQAIYDWLRSLGGRATINALRSRLHVSEWELSALIHAFEEYALAFDTFSNGERVLFIPQETLANLQRADGRPHAAVGLRETEAPHSIRPADTAFLWDIAVLVAASYAQEIELTRSGTLPKRAAQRLTPLLVGERAQRSEREALDYVELLKQQAHDLGLVLAAPSTARQRSRLSPGPKLESWARHDLVMQVRRLFRRWPNDRWWTDMPGARYHDFHSFYIEIPLARELVTQLLKRCRSGVWYSLDSFLATLQSDDPYVLRPSQRCAGEAGFKLAEELRAHWDATDGEIITGMFRSTLYDLGMVALGYDRDVVPSAGEVVNPDRFMLTELGAEVLGGEQSASQMFSSRALVVQPNFQVLLMEPYMPAIYWLLRYGSLEQVGRVSRFTLTREGLQRGMADGATIDDVLMFLQTHSQKSLPQNVVYTLRDWARQGQEQPLPRITLLEVNDESLAGELVTTPRLRAYRLRRVGPKAVAVPPETNVDDLHRDLKRLGYAQKLRSGFDELVEVNAPVPSRRRTREDRARGA